MANQLKAATVPSPGASEFVPAFDLNNPQHLAMRRLMADVYGRHANAVEEGVMTSAARYRGMADGLGRAAYHVLNDRTLDCLCSQLNAALFYREEAYSKRCAA